MATTILLYGRTGSGKTAQVGKLAEDVFVRTKKKTRLYTADNGGTDTIQPYIDLGIIESVTLGTSNPWIWLNAAVNGKVRGKDGKWILDRAANEHVGMYAFESLRSVAKALMIHMAEQGAQGVNIGGGSNVSFQVQGDGETLKVSGNNPAHYGNAQSKVLEQVLHSFKTLAAAEYIIWTSGVSKDEDSVSSGKVLGPDVVGKALTPELPIDFNYTLRIDVLPASFGKEERHLLYLGSHADVNAGNAAALGNIRRPLDAPPIKNAIVEPADLVGALKMLRDEGRKAATAAIAARVGIKQ